MVGANGKGPECLSNFTEKIESYPYRIVVSRDTKLGVWNLLLASTVCGTNVVDS